MQGGGWREESREKVRRNWNMPYKCLNGTKSDGDSECFEGNKLWKFVEVLVENFLQFFITIRYDRIVLVINVRKLYFLIQFIINTIDQPIYFSSIVIIKNTCFKFSLIHQNDLTFLFNKIKWISLPLIFSSFTYIYIYFFFVINIRAIFQFHFIVHRLKDTYFPALHPRIHISKSCSSFSSRVSRIRAKF